MGSDAPTRWSRFCAGHLSLPDVGVAIDVSDAGLDEAWRASMSDAVARALDAMEQLEDGAIANPDEQRMVGHYWLRDPDRAPDPAMTEAIRATAADVSEFATTIRSEGRFEHLLHIGIGGSALGPQLVCDALDGSADGLRTHFIDNTDPDGFDRVLAGLAGRLDRTMVSVASKSGGTPEPRNAMLETRAAFERAGVPFAPNAVAITSAGSRLDELASGEGWRRRFPIWDWVGGRTSLMSAMGLVPAALRGIDVEALLAGARAMDRHTRHRDVDANPAVLMALAWHRLAEGRGAKDLVILPYKDRLILLARYLQQLVMESLGKERDRGGDAVHQGLTIYGNKGSTDQHAYVQQLREGVANFFVTFIEVLRDRPGASMEVEPGVTAGDYLAGFLHGTRAALHENGRASFTITLDDVSPASLGALIALYERTVGIYAEMIDVNAYHQPGVEAGKKAAAGVLDLQQRIVACVHGAAGPMTVETLAEAVGASDEPETVFRIVRHLAANDRGIALHGTRPDDARVLPG